MDIQGLKLHVLPLLILAILNPLYIHVRARKVMLLIKATENETMNFIKRRSKKRIQFIEDMKLTGINNKLVLVRVKYLYM